MEGVSGGSTFISDHDFAFDVLPRLISARISKFKILYMFMILIFQYWDWISGTELQTEAYFCLR